MTGPPVVLKKARATLIDALFEPFRQPTLGVDNRPGPKPEQAPLNQPFTSIRKVAPSDPERLVPHRAVHCGGVGGGNSRTCQLRSLGQCGLWFMHARVRQTPSFG